MKPARFAYDDPRELDEALALLAERGDEAKILAGGQSLVPLLNFRLARPARLIDINRLDELAYLRESDRTLRIGALTRESALERSPVVAAGWPLLAEGVRFVGHPQIRNRGTVGGSVAHADPAAELPAVFVTLKARFHALSVRGQRRIEAADMFLGYFSTALEPDELLVEIEVPRLPPRTGSAFIEYARVHGAFALGGAAAAVTLSEEGACERAAIGLLGAAAMPVRAAAAAEAALVGRPVDGEAAEAAAGLAAADLEPPGDLRVSSDYRRALIKELTRQAILQAAARAEEATA